MGSVRRALRDSFRSLPRAARSTAVPLPQSDNWPIGSERAPMDHRVFDKASLPSRYVTEGTSRAPHRSYLYAMGLTRKQIHQPLIAVASCWNEAAPCNIALMRQAQAVKKGVAAAGGTPREFC